MAEEENSFELVESRDAMELVPQREIPGWWFAAGFAGLLVIAALLLLFRKSTKTEDPQARERMAYLKAKDELGDLGTEGVRDTAIHVSVILRRYLADALGEPALFETHEEFVSRHDGLKDLSEEVRHETGEFFSQLAEVKYAVEVPEGCDSGKMAEGGMKLLERMHAA
ncbi:MAG: hypothetical protein NWT08_07650 [Akkermansiaceae bacterium]|jgi:hypothetical protein|nr:hypothetical protein [Akkermansiaceae bacterium]MDP4647196.1 hypothetical protein [Akkermansiaceae bacterium]MDP4720114.1 hypothetical protein [Akkermansiaceae bacterium]MDP4780927.1 hypothetical protein [Akkermansiaceae bacterium]MDP4845750.1 hypothetical protein [Akkermansiaceae bacterium]